MTPRAVPALTPGIIVLINFSGRYLTHYNEFQKSFKFFAMQFLTREIFKLKRLYKIK